MEKPWENEQSHLEWFTAAGLLGVIHRVEWQGHLCGYVRVPAGHPWHGVEREFDIDATCHGGVTYTRNYKPGGPEPDPDGGWFVGFDCAHAGDLSPRTMERLGRTHPSSDETYRTLDYVKHEVEQLAAQAVAAGADSWLAPALSA